MSNVACRLFKEQIELINNLPEQERPQVLYAAVMNAFNQFDNQFEKQFDNQFEKQNDNQNYLYLYLLSKSLSKESMNVLNNTVILNIKEGF